jgi:hypothetical protein
MLVETVGDATDVNDAGLAAGRLAGGLADGLGDAWDLANILALLEKRHTVGLVVAGIQLGSENERILVLSIVLVVLGGLIGCLLDGFLDGLGSLLLAVCFGNLFLGL